MTGWDREQVAGAHHELAAIRHAHACRAADHEADMTDLAQPRARDRPDVLAPSPAGGVDRAADLVAADPVELEAPVAERANLDGRSHPNDLWLDHHPVVAGGRGPGLDEIALATSRALVPTGAVRSTDSARFIRRDALPGVEALHATFVRHRYAPHIHDDLAIACVDRGAARFALDNHDHVAPAGTVFVIPPHAVHTGEPATVAGYTYRVLYLEPAQLAARMGRASLSYTWRTATTVVHSCDLAGALERFHGLVTAPAAALEQCEALAVVARVLDDVLRAPAAPRTSREHRGVRAARDYIHAHRREDFSLDQLARAVGLSPFYLVRSFRAHIGVPPSAYRRALRVEAARQRLHAGEPASRVAAQCGFYDQAHLNRHFKLATGVTPTSYARGDRF
jgi:AraC-like DNA-binding protein